MLQIFFGETAFELQTKSQKLLEMAILAVLRCSVRWGDACAVARSPRGHRQGFHCCVIPSEDVVGDRFYLF
eukprot:5608195-Prymnesium_polylepis.1